MGGVVDKAKLTEQQKQNDEEHKKEVDVSYGLL